MDAAAVGNVVLGLVLLAGGGELLVRGAARLAEAFGISRLVVGLTVVAWGTSAPELAVSLRAGLAGNADIAVANVVGSNLFNVLAILGGCALAAPLIVHRQLVRLEVPLLIAVSAAMFPLVADRRVSPLEGAVLVAGLVGWTVWTVRRGRREEAESAAERASAGDPAPPSAPPGALALQLGWIAAGLALLVVGADRMVGGAVALASALGVSDVVIGLTIVAAGTSLPEVAASLVATLKGERDIAVGNVIGSNLSNLLAIVGMASVVTPGGLAVAPSLVNFDLPVMCAAALACLPIFASGRMARWQGAVFVGYYGAYLAYLVLDSTGHDALPEFAAVMIEFVVPLTVLTFAAVGLRAWRQRRAE